jgi:hypothetical protein
MAFATTIAPHCKPAFIASVIILSATISNDINEHLLILRQVSLPWKVLVICQILVCVYICVLNASNAAGQDDAVDILMNSTGLLVLNDMDNIVAAMF